MGQARRRKLAAAAAQALPKKSIALAIRSAILDTAKAFNAADGFCALHAAVGQRVLRERFGISAAIAAGDLQRAINDRVVHSYAIGGTRIDAAIGACHVWLVDDATKATIDFDAWEEPVRYAASGEPQGPWTASRPEFYWVTPGEPCDGIVKVVPDRNATDVVVDRLRHGATVVFVATAVAKALEYLDMVPL